MIEFKIHRPCKIAFCVRSICYFTRSIYNKAAFVLSILNCQNFRQILAKQSRTSLFIYSYTTCFHQSKKLYIQPNRNTYSSSVHVVQSVFLTQSVCLFVCLSVSLSLSPRTKRKKTQNEEKKRNEKNTVIQYHCSLLGSTMQ